MPVRASAHGPAPRSTRLPSPGRGRGVLTAGCRTRKAGEPIVLRLSHSMTAGPTSLHSFGAAFRELAEAKTGGAVQVRLFPSGTLGQEREVVQQLQEGLVDFMVSGTAIWGSVAPKLQLFDFPFLWRDWDHVHGVVDGTRRPRGRGLHGGGGPGPPPGLGRFVRLPPGGHPVARRERGGPARRSQDPDHPVADLSAGGGAHGREPDAHGFRRGVHVAPDGRHRRLRARREHHPATALLRGRALHGAHPAHRGRPGPVRLERRAWPRFLRTCAPSFRPRPRRPPRASVPWAIARIGPRPNSSPGKG